MKKLIHNEINAVVYYTNEFLPIDLAALLLCDNEKTQLSLHTMIKCHVNIHAS